MKSIVYKKFGTPDVLECKETEKPKPTDNEILVKTHATSVNTIDIAYRSGTKAMFGLARLTIGIFKPRKTVLGFEVAGEVIQIGDRVTKFKIGDKVFGGALSGGNAEFTLVKENQVALIPANINFLEASAMPMTGLSALQALKPLNIQPGTKILIYGASGGIGTLAIQLAKVYGAQVTAVASGKNENLVRSLGADDFIDYTKEDFFLRGEKYDIIFDTVSKVKDWKKALKDDGIFINAGSPKMSMVGFITSQLGNKFRRKKYTSFSTKYVKEDLDYLAELVKNDKLRPVIDKTFTLDEIVLAHEYYEKGHTAGKVVISII